ncbi:MAG: hypothetical protein R3F20_16445 [Planctomycetota bacterium]
MKTLMTGAIAIALLVALGGCCSGETSRAAMAQTPEPCESCAEPCETCGDEPSTARHPLDELDFGEVYNGYPEFSRKGLEGKLVLVENALWDNWRDWGYYPDVSRFAREQAGNVVVITLADPAPAAEIRARIDRLGIRHPVLVDRGFRFGYHFITPTGRIEGSALDKLTETTSRLRWSRAR